MKNEDMFDPNNNEVTSTEFYSFLVFVSFFILLVLFSVGVGGTKLNNFSMEKIEYKMSEQFNTDYYKRVTYLTNYCELIPGLEVINNDKSSFKCLDGKIYLEHIPEYVLLNEYQDILKK